MWKDTDDRKQDKQKRTPIKRDYTKQTESNRITGLKGERYVVEYEKDQLHGNKKLQSKVEEVSVTRGDGLGYDVLSFNPDGSEKHIEVKTTTSSENTPFHISQNELLYSKEESSSYWLYRVYDIDKKVKLEKYRGNLEQYFFFEPINYIASKKNLWIIKVSLIIKALSSNSFKQWYNTYRDTLSSAWHMTNTNHNHP